MKFREWNEIAELVGITAIVASLIFVGLQMKQAEDIANAARRTSVVANFIELSNTINEYASVWVRGNAGGDLDDIETVIFENLVWAKTQFHQHESYAARNLGSQIGTKAHIVSLVSFLYENPGARRVWNAQREPFRKIMPLIEPLANDATPRFNDEIHSTLEKLDQTED